MKTDHDLEQLLMSGKKLSLSISDKASIKSTLLEHASETLKNEKHAFVSPWMSWIIRGSVSFATVLIVFIGTAYASQDSLPGEPLYAMKVYVVEEIIALTKTDPSEHIAYDIQLMETRLAELKELATQDERPFQDDLDRLTHQIEEHITDITDTLKATETSKMPHEDKIKTLSKLSGIAKAQAKITKDEDDFSMIAETVQDTQKTTSDSLNTAVQDFASNQTAETINDYLSDQMSIVSDQINASTTDEDTRDSAEQHLNDVDESLSDGNTTDALISVLEAQQAIITDSYFDTPRKNHKNGSTTDTP